MRRKKRNFLRHSRRRRAVVRLGVLAIVIFAIAGAWLVNSRYQRYNARTYLADNNLPPELYDWQHQLKILTLYERPNG